MGTHLSKESRRLEMFTHIEAWESSKRSQHKYCKENGLSVSTFIYWLKKYHEPKDHPVKTSFIPLTVTNTEENHRRFELDLPGDIHLRIYY